MQGFTTIQYGNSFKLYNCVTEEFRQEAVFDQTGTDLLYWKFTVRVTGYIHGHSNWPLSYHAPLDGTTPQGDAAVQERRLRALVEPRGELFRMKVGVTNVSDPDSGTVLLYASPCPDDVSAGLSNYDVNNGPKCKIIAITHIAANEVFRVSAEFEICKPECTSSGDIADVGKTPGNTQGVLSNRWSVSDDIDEDFYTTRTYSGRLVLASSNLDANAFRSLCVPKLMPGLKRRMAFTVTADGKNLDYTIVDREVAFSAPYPATSWAVTHSEEAVIGQLTTAIVDVRLTGDRNVNKKQLMLLAIYVMSAKLFNSPLEANLAAIKNVIAKRFRIVDHIGDRSSVQVYAEVQKTPPEKKSGFFVDTRQIGKPIDATMIPNYDGNFSYGARSGDPLVVSGAIQIAGAWKSYLQSPCDNEHNIDEQLGPSSQVSKTPGPAGDLSVRVSDDPLPPEPTSEFSQDHLDLPYSYYQAESLYSTSGNQAHMPIASTYNSSGPVSRVIDLAPKTTKRTLRIKAERVGEWPEMPLAQDYQENGEVISGDAKVQFGTPEMTANGQQIYRTLVELDFFLTHRYDQNQPHRVGVNPWRSPQNRLVQSNPAMFRPESSGP